MKYLILCFLFVFITVFNYIYADENTEALTNQAPIVLVNYASLITTETTIKTTWSRSDLLANFSFNQLKSKDNLLTIQNLAVEFLTPEKSAANYADYYERVKNLPLVMYKWEFEIEKEGSYLLAIPTDLGTLGYLNDEPIIVLTDGILSKKNSGKLWTELPKGKKTIYLHTRPGKSNRLSIISKIDGNKIRTEISKKITSKTKEDIAWATNDYIPYLGRLKQIVHTYIISEIARLNKKNPIEKSDESMALLKSLIPVEYFDGYMVEKYIFTNFPDLYFHLSKKGEAKNAIHDSFFLTKNEFSLKFYQQLIYDGQKSLADTFFTKCLDQLNSLNDLANKDKLISNLYSTRFLHYFYIGRIRECNEILKVTQDMVKPFPLGGYIEGRPDQEDTVTLTQSFDETNAYQIKESIDSYDGSPDQLPSLYKTFLALENNLVKRNDGAVSQYYYFQVCKNENDKLKKEFENFCIEKIKSNVIRATETRSIKLLEEIIAKYECITPLPELRVILMEEYFNCGANLKALSQAHLIYEKYPKFHPKIISKLTVLEEISEIPYEQRKRIPPELSKTALKINGQNTTIENIYKTKLKNTQSEKSIGKFLKSIPLIPTHSQYWNHPQISGYQPTEILFTQNNILFNSASQLFNYSPTENKVTWNYQSEAEYKKDNENGPHQKRFITRHSGDQLFTFTNRNHSSQKSVKSFDLKGNILWDMSDQSISLIEEPLCTPMESQGKLFGFSISNRETINTISFCVYDSSNGKLLNRTPISYIPNNGRDIHCRGIGSNWNTFTHDDHFTSDNTFVYGYSGSGIILKADSNSGFILWEKGFPKTNRNDGYDYWKTYGSAPSGYIKLFGDTLLTYMPDIQMFTALNKHTGEYIWKTLFRSPRFIHARGNTEAVYYSSFDINNQPLLFKINPQDGQIIWQTPTNGLAINGEGDILDGKLYLPSEKSLLVFDAKTGAFVNAINFNLQPLKFRCSPENSVILTSNAAYIFQNDGKLDTNQIKDIGQAIVVGKIFEPDAPLPPTISFENINLETTLKIPETTYTSPDPWKKTQLIKTSKLYHFLLKCRDNLTLFREGYYLKNGLYIPPEIIWFGQYPWHDIFEDTLYISEYGKITASNLFTRETLWVYDYEQLTPVVRNSWYKAPPAICVTNQYIAFQTENQSIRVIDIKTKNLIIEFYSPSVNTIKMSGPYLVTSNGSGPTTCYDISQNAKALWTQTYGHYADIFIDGDKLVYYRTNSSNVTFYDLKTGAEVVKATSTFPGDYYIQNRFQLDDKILFAYRNLYDAKTGQPLKYQAGTAVTGGGYFGFYKRYGQEGDYIYNGKVYPFKTRGNFNDDNYLYSVIRRGNRIVFFSFFFIETFEIVEDKLVSIDYSSITTGRYGSHGDQVNMDLFVLDNSLLEIRRDDMYFYQNFDPDLNFEEIKSFRVENRRKFNWPYSELYPEVNVTEKNWISYYGQKPKQTLSYQAFGDENYAYLKFVLSPNLKKDFTNTLYLSTDGIIGKISIIWDIENWNNAQTSFNANEKVESWKETDVKGNVSLYLKLKLTGTFPLSFKYTLPNFNIEFRQKTGNQNDGAYRIGGAYQGIINQLPWLNYTNDEAQSLKNFALRTALYENKVNFYPQGMDLILWLKDRRRLKSTEDNILLLQNMLGLNAKFYCSVNILSALLVEEIQLLKEKNNGLDELSESFSKKISDIVTKLNTLAKSKGMEKEWADFALSFWTIEIFPYKISYSANRNDYTKPFYATTLYANNRPIMSNNYSNKRNLLSPFINRPFIEWIIPGLIANFPQGQEIKSVTLEYFGINKTALGKIMAYTPQGPKEFCNRNGKSNDPNFQILKEGKTVMPIKNNFYWCNNQKYDCFSIENNFPTLSIGITLPMIKMPTTLSSTGQTIESIKFTLDNLPTDNTNGIILIDNYMALSGKTDDAELINVYSKWLDSLRNNSESCYTAIRNIFDRNAARKDAFEFVEKIIKEAKLLPNAPRRFYLDRRNIIFDKDVKSVLGPITKDLTNKPENILDGKIEYKTVDSAHVFKDALDPIKGGIIYVACKINAENAERAFVFARAFNNYATVHTSSLFSIWLNNKSIVINVPFLDFDENTFYQRINLNKGENIILMKIVGIENYDWGRNYSFNIGDVYGAPINGLELKPIHK